MFNRKFGLRRKRAGITVELLLAVVLAVVVLFLILGLFSNNLKHMVVNGNISRIFANNSAKTAYSSWGTNPTQTQVNVQTVADNGALIRQYLNKARAAIDNYKTNLPTTIEQKEDLARQITIERVIGNNDYMNNTELAGYNTPDYGNIMANVNRKSKDYYTTVEDADGTTLYLHYNESGNDISFRTDSKLNYGYILSAINEILNNDFEYN